MSDPPKDLSQGSWRWNGFEWVPSDTPGVQPTNTAERLGWSSRALIATGVIITVLIVGLVGVAVGFRVTTKPPPAATSKPLTAAAIVVLASEQVRTTDSYQLTGSSPDDNTSFEVKQQDATTVEIDDTIGDLKASMIETDGRAYINANGAFYKKYSPNLGVVAGRWLIFPMDLSPQPLKDVDDFRNNLVCGMTHPVPWKLARDTTVNGTPVHHVYVDQNGDRVDLYVASQGIAYLMRIDIAVTSTNVTVAYRTSSSAVTGQCTGGVGANRPGTNEHYRIDFSNWGDDVRIGVPSEPIPLIKKPTTS